MAEQFRVLEALYPAWLSRVRSYELLAEIGIEKNHRHLAATVILFALVMFCSYVSIVSFLASLRFAGFLATAIHARTGTSLTCGKTR